MDDGLADPAGRDRLALGPLDGSLGFLLRLSQLRSFRDYFRSFGEDGIRPGELSVLMLLAENPGIRQGVLARALMIKRAHMAKMVRAMEEDGLLTRSVPDSDRRALELRLTERGAARVAALLPAFEAHEGAGVATLDAAEEAELKRLLRKYLGLGEDTP